MSENIRISVDGVHGAVAARSAGIRLVTPSQELALTGVSPRNPTPILWLPSVRRLPSIILAPAGSSVLELSRSTALEDRQPSSLSAL